MTPNKEDYLKCIHELGEHNQKISNKKIAEKMGVSAPAVSEMIKKIIQQEWIIKDSQKGYYLTEKGRQLVSNLYRKHRLLEIFLINHLHYSAEEVHQEAEVLEHTVSDIFVDRLEESLHFPRFCPHGGTIPRKNQELVEINHTTLKSITETGDYRLSRVHDEYGLLHYMETHNMTVGMTFSLTHIDSYAETYTIKYPKHELAIPAHIAEQFYVTKKH